MVEITMVSWERTRRLWLIAGDRIWYKLRLFCSIAGFQEAHSFGMAQVGVKTHIGVVPGHRIVNRVWPISEAHRTPSARITVRNSRLIACGTGWRMWE